MLCSEEGRESLVTEVTPDVSLGGWEEPGGSREGPVGLWNPGEDGAVPAKTPPWVPVTALAGERGRAGRSG